MTRSSLGFAIVFSASLASTGCMTDGEWSITRMLGWDDTKPRSSMKAPKADLATAQRVDELGRKIIAQNTFTGIEPMFHTIGVQETVLFHRGTEELMVSQGLVKQCKTEAELAAVLCSELGQMMADKRGAAAAARNATRFRKSEFRPVQAWEVAHPLTQPAPRSSRVKRSAKDKSRGRGGRCRKILRDLMRNAGYDPAEIERRTDPQTIRTRRNDPEATQRFRASSRNGIGKFYSFGIIQDCADRV